MIKCYIVFGLGDCYDNPEFPYMDHFFVPLSFCIATDLVVIFASYVLLFSSTTRSDLFLLNTH